MSIGDTIQATLTTEVLEKALEVFQNVKNKKEFIDKIPASKNITRQQAIDRLKQSHKDEDLCLVLGAGVSMAYGLPNWDTLLQKLMIETIEKEKNVSSVLSKLFTNIFDPSPLIAGRYLQNYFDKKELSFERAVRKILYEKIKLDTKSELMDEIVGFCVAPGNSPSLNSIITYNFDDILEQKLNQVGVDIPFQSIYGIGMNANGQLPIYHVHGFLPEKGKLTMQNLITFGESIYHKQYSDIYSWNNIVQINKFRESNCLFVGSSLTDPNTRRLLDIARKQKGRGNENHFTFRMRHTKERVKNKLQYLLSENNQLLNEKMLAQLDFDDTVSFLISIVEKFEESDTNSFGVKIIWIDSYSEIPKILKEIRKGKAA